MFKLTAVFLLFAISTIHCCCDSLDENDKNDEIQDADSDQFPHIATIHASSLLPKAPVALGSIIDKKWILTVVDPWKMPGIAYPSQYYVSVGAVVTNKNRSDDENESKEHKIKKFHVFEGSNVALVELGADIELDNTTAAIIQIGNLNATQNHTHIYWNDDKFVYVEINVTDETPQKLKVNRSGCSGQSGSPLISEDGELIGIKTANNTPLLCFCNNNVFYKANIFKEWINETMKKTYK